MLVIYHINIEVSEIANMYKFIVRNIIQSHHSTPTLSKYIQHRYLAIQSLDEIIINNRIIYPEMRVVFTDEEGKKGWKIMSRIEALQFAKQQNLDLILGTVNTK